jgi:hypothetical protein
MPRSPDLTNAVAQQRLAEAAMRIRCLQLLDESQEGAVDLAAQRVIRRGGHFLHQRDDARNETVDDIGVEARGRVSRSFAELRIQHARMTHEPALERAKSVFHERPMPVALGEHAQYAAGRARRVEAAQTRQQHPFDEARSFVLVDGVQHAGKRFDERRRDDLAVRAIRQRLRQRLCRIVTAELRDDQFGLQEILFDEPAETLRDAWLIPRDDRRMRQRQRERMTEERDHRIPVRDCADGSRFGERSQPREPRIPLLENDACEQQHGHASEQTSRRAPHAGHPAFLLAFRRGGRVRGRPSPVAKRQAQPGS